jgi:hypothetical protein
LEEYHSFDGIPSLGHLGMGALEQKEDKAKAEEDKKGAEMTREHLKVEWKVEEEDEVPYVEENWKEFRTPVMWKWRNFTGGCM